MSEAYNVAMLILELKKQLNTARSLIKEAIESDVNNAMDGVHTNKMRKFLKQFEAEVPRGQSRRRYE